ncbi:MAG: hypothetical protein QMD53_05830 [Actinomycetota bacterium]|nr:hypothetical protein [Actinomycetota bacterium]
MVGKNSLPADTEKEIKRLGAKSALIIGGSGAAPEASDFLMLATDPTPFKGERLINVTKEVEGAENVRLSGRFLTRVFDGPFKDIRKWLEDMKGFVAERGGRVKNIYAYYTTCPKCAKKYGHNYVVLFAEAD